jgi:uncharacterized protein YbaR (Trm112 family)
MFIELVDSLRCTSEHDDTWLVASTKSMQGRHIMDGELGCPLCRAHYPIRSGIAHFGDPKATAATSLDPDGVVMLAALLGLADGSGKVVLLGPSYSVLARPLHELTGTQVIVIDPAPAAEMGNGLSGIAGCARLPLASSSLHGVALDDYTRGLVHEAARVLKPEGRVTAPSQLPLADGLGELARDEAQWVAERTAPAKIVELHRRR